MTPFDFTKYLKNNPLLKESVNEAPLDGPAAGNESAAMIAWLKNKYGPFVPITPEEKKDLDYAGIGSGPESLGVFKLKTPIANPDEDDDSAFHTKVAYVHLLKADEDYEAPYYYEVRETVEYPGDFEEGFGGYGYPDGIWNGTEFEPVG